MTRPMPQRRKPAFDPSDSGDKFVLEQSGNDIMAVKLSRGIKPRQYRKSEVQRRQAKEREFLKQPRTI